MQRNHKMVSAGGSAIMWCALLNAIILEQAFTGHPALYRLVVITLPLLLCAVIASRGRQKTIGPRVLTKLKTQVS